MSTSEQSSPQDDARSTFPRLELPPVPSFGRAVEARAASVPTATPVPTVLPAAAPATSLDGRPVGGQDEAAGDWQYPYAPAATTPTGAVSQVVAPPVPATHGLVPAEPAPAELAPAELAPTSPDATAPEDDADAGPSTVVLVLLAVLTIALLWASRMAFSAGLLAFASVLMAELSVAASLARRPGASRPTSATVPAIGALVIALNAARHAFVQFGEDAFVAGLFVLIAAVPTLLLLGVATLLLRRSSAPSRANDALQSWTLVRFAALGALIVAGIQAHRTFSARPDAIVALGIVALTVVTVVSVLRGTGRAALPASSPT